MPTKSRQLQRKFTPRFWEGLDGRTNTAQLIRARYEQLRDDVGATSTQRDILAQRAVFLSLVLETQEVEAATEGKLDLGVYTQGLNALTGVLRALGLDKQVKKVGSLDDYIAGKSGGGGK